MRFDPGFPVLLAIALATGIAVNAADAGTIDDRFHAAQQLSWDGKYDEAVRAYDAILKENPEYLPAILERAKVLSWNRRYLEAADGFHEVLKREPRNREARLGLARSLSWSGNQDDARFEYEKLVRRDPADTDALVGVAQTWAWSGNPSKARSFYEKALAAEPGKKEAEMGLAYLEIQSGEPYAASTRAERLAKAYPDDKEVAELRTAAAKARAAWIEVGVERMDDSDDVALNVYRVEGGLPLPARLDLRAGIGRWDTRQPGLDGSYDALWAALGWTARAGVRLEGRLGVDRTKDSTGDRRSVGTRGATVAFPLGGSWRASVDYDRRPFRYSPAILDNRIVIADGRATVSGTFAGRWSAELTPGYWYLSDGNSRKSFDGMVAYRWPLGKPTISTGYAFRWRDFDQDLDHGYFDPSSFTAHAATVQLSGPFGKSKADWGVYAELGIQSFTLGATDVSNDFFYAARVRAGVPLTERVSLEAWAGTGTYANQGGENWRSREIGVRFHFTIGGR